VSPGSQTETFAALRLEIDNWRWSGVPFFIRAGKELPERVTEVRIIFKPPPRLVFSPHTPPPDEFVVRIDPTPGADLVVQVKDPGPEASLRTIDLSLIFSGELGDPPEPYERLFGDVLQGEARTSSARTARRRRGASCSRCWTRHPRWSPTPAGPGDRPPRTPCLSGTRAGATPGSLRPWRADAPASAARA
jgi:Glucose-6-phosphate 1-dehydrogenase